MGLRGMVGLMGLMGLIGIRGIRGLLGLMGSMVAVEGEAVLVADAGAAEEVEGGADGEVDAALAEAVDVFEVLEGAGAAGVGDGDGGGLGEELDEVMVDAKAEAFLVHGVDEEFGAGLGEVLEGGLVDFELGEGLPTVGDHEVGVVAAATAQVEDQSLAADGADEVGEAGLVQVAIAKDPGGDDDVGGAGVEPGAGVVGVDTAADVEAAGVGGEGVVGGLVIAGAEHDDMAAGEAVVAVALGEPGGGSIGFETGDGVGAGIGEGATDDLDHLAAAQVDAGTKHCGDDDDYDYGYD